MNYATMIIFGAFINVMAGAALIAVFDNNLGFLGLIAGVVMMVVGFIVNVVNAK